VLIVIIDTSCILKWLIEKGYDVVCFMASKLDPWLLFARRVLHPLTYHIDIGQEVSRIA
jgi:hypothetical protein